MCAEWWAFEIVVVLSGIMGVKELAAMVVIINLMA